MANIEDILNSVLAPLNVQVRFSASAIEDLAAYKKEQQEKILALIIARAKNGPLLKPHGIGEPLHGELHGFTKIKPKHLALRIVYRPVQTRDGVIMEIIAIGPRDREKVYRLAAKRLIAFQAEMQARRNNDSQHQGNGDP